MGVLCDWCGSPGGAAAEPDAMDDPGIGIKGGAATSIKMLRARITNPRSFLHWIEYYDLRLLLVDKGL